jgi:hypothetical protein
MTPEEAELTTTLAADLINLINRPEYQHLDWLHAVAALSLAGRGLAARVIADDPAMTLDRARRLMLGQFLHVLNMPPEIVTVVDADGEGKAAMIPLKKH